ncbi:hypothetical protein [Peribacillus muralis]|uniref:hypothetical protein n=1 Tax=Peribacillus muralis TaxID=264697 RepID=UPI003D06CABA
MYKNSAFIFCSLLFLNINHELFHPLGYSYNNSNQIESKNGIKYKYDLDGNLIQDENYKYQYDAVGAQISVTDIKDNEVARYEYDEEGKLQTKKIVGTKTYEYYYDGDQLTLEIIRNANSIEEYRNYLWGGHHIIAGKLYV